jgi:hypothetical protein
LQGRKQDIGFIPIAIGELHVGLASDMRVIPFWKQIDLKEDLLEADSFLFSTKSSKDN